MTQPGIVLFGRDQTLVDSRLLMLRCQGYRVFCTQHMDEAKRLAQIELIGLHILCHTVPDDERMEVVSAAKCVNPAVQCLWLLDFSGASAPAGVTGFSMNEGPERFIEVVKKLMNRELNPYI